MTEEKAMVNERREAGFTLPELAIMMAIVGIAASMAVPASNDLFSNQRLNDSADSLNRAFAYARGEAIRTGNLHIVFTQTDAQGKTLEDINGDPVDILVLNDGRPGAAGQNCVINAGEATVTMSLETGITFGSSVAGSKVTTDSGDGSLSGGSTFTDAGGSQASWVLFRPDGTPLSFSADCSTGAIGTGGGGVYLSNGRRDAALVVTPLGASRVHSHRSGATWSS